MPAFDLNRFLEAQEHSYARALQEIKKGRKISHWMWYIFPQVKGLGFSAMANKYGIESLQEAAAYLKHPVLGPRLIEISKALLMLETNDAYAVFGSPDNMKLKSSMTLFSLVNETDGVFEAVLQKFFDGTKDDRTLRLCGEKA